MREKAKRQIDEARGFYWWTNEKYHPVRTLKQNSYWFVAYVPALADFLSACFGETWTEEDAHDWAKRAWLPVVVRHMPNGDEFRMPMRSRDLTTKEFAEMVDQCKLMLGEAGIEIPERECFEKEK